MVQGFAGYNSYVAPSLQRTWGYLHSATGVPVSASDFIRLPEAIGERSDRLDGINLVANFDRTTQSVTARPDPDPRAYLVFESERVADWRAAEEKMASRRDFHRVALEEEASPSGFAPEPGDHHGTASVAAFGSERVVVSTSSDSPGLLVLAEAWYPGWKATVGGRPAKVIPVNGWMRGVVVPSGQNEVVFAFQSRFLAAGMAVSLASAVTLLALAARRRRSG